MAWRRPGDWRKIFGGNNIVFFFPVEVTGKRRLSTSSQSPSVKVASLLKLLATDDKLTVVYEGEEQSATLVQVDRFKYQVVVSLGGNNLTLPWQAVVAEADQEDTEPEMPEEQAAEVQAPVEVPQERKPPTAGRKNKKRKLSEVSAFTCIPRLFHSLKLLHMHFSRQRAGSPIPIQSCLFVKMWRFRRK